MSGTNAIHLLAEKIEYEAWFLEAVYSIVEQELFPCFPDAVIYPANKTLPEFIGYARANIIIGDWRTGFLNAGAPLVFVASFKLLDMFIEWVLEENGFPSTFRFQKKIKNLSRSPTFPELIESRSWLKDRLVGLYRVLEPLRGTIIHDKHFTSSDGVIRVSSSKANVVGPQIEIGPDELRKLALTVVSIFKYIDGTWNLDQYREKLLRNHLDSLSSLHGCSVLGQKEPYYPTVRIFSADLRVVDPVKIYADLVEQYPNNDCMFDLRVLIVNENCVVEAYLFPWEFLNEGGFKKCVDLEVYRTPVPNDIDPEHYGG